MATLRLRRHRPPHFVSDPQATHRVTLADDAAAEVATQRQRELERLRKAARVYLAHRIQHHVAKATYKRHQRLTVEQHIPDTTEYLSQ